MYEVTVLPNRVRFKCNRIYGNNSLAKYIKLYIDNLSGVSYCKVNFHTCSILINFNEDKTNVLTLKKNISDILLTCIKKDVRSFTPYEKYYEALNKKNKAKRKVIISGLVYIIIKLKQSIYGKFSISRNLNVLKAASIVTIIGGYPLLKNIYKKFAKNMPTDSDILLKLTAVSFTLMRESSKGIFVLFLRNVSDYIKFSADTECLKQFNQNMQSNKGLVRLINKGQEILVPLSSINIGDNIKVIKGEIIPAEGTIISGAAAVNNLYYNGQPTVLNVEKGMKVQEGISVISGEIHIKVSAVSNIYNRYNSSIDNLMLNKKVTNYQRLSTNFALGASVLNYVLFKNILTSLSILLVLCPSASSTAFKSGIKNYFSLLNKNNMYLRNVNAFDEIRHIDSIIFDKTGTLTEGVMSIENITSFDPNYSENDLLKICAACEINNNHPISISLQKAANNNSNTEKAENTLLIPSKGIKCKYDDKTILIGNKSLMEENNIDISSHLQQYENCEKKLLKPILVSIDNNICGLFALKEKLRKNANILIKKLKNNGINNIYILTGDNQHSANYTASCLGIENIYSECSYEDKVNVINTLKRRHNVMMVGDGINDALAMKTANVSLSFAHNSCDKIKLASDCIIFNDDISKLADFISLTKKSYNKISQSLFFSKNYNFILAYFAFAGYLNPFTAKSLNTINSLIVLLLNKRIELISPKRLYEPKVNNLSDKNYSINHTTALSHAY